MLNTEHKHHDEDNLEQNIGCDVRGRLPRNDLSPLHFVLRLGGELATYPFQNGKDHLLAGLVATEASTSAGSGGWWVALRIRALQRQRSLSGVLIGSESSAGELAILRWGADSAAVLCLSSESLVI